MIKNEIINVISNEIMNGVMQGARFLAQNGVKSIQKITDVLGNIMKITTYKNHNIDIHFFMK